MNYSIKRTNCRSDEYDSYIEKHVENVRKAWVQFMRPVILELYPELITTIEYHLDNHDASKYAEEEYDGYCNWFYPSKACPKNQFLYDRAWLHHQKFNPHHWQYWVIITDEGQIHPIDMPVEYIVEMLCDWHSFTGVDPNSTAYLWYTQHRNSMHLSENTIKLVEELIEYLKEPIT